jgi:hypothetical protein
MAFFIPSFGVEVGKCAEEKKSRNAGAAAL